MKSVLLIDDDEIFNFLNARIISESGFHVSILSCLSAQEGFNILKESNPLDETFPHLIFLDVKMPGMSGHEFLKELNELPEEIKQKVSIVMLSSSLDPRDVDKSMRYPQVVEFIEKPLDEFKLHELVRKHAGLLEYPAQ